MKKSRIILFMLLFVFILVPITALADPLVIKPAPDITIVSGETKNLICPVYEGSHELDRDSFYFYTVSVGSNKYVRGKKKEVEDESVISLTGLKAGVTEINYTVKAEFASWEHMDPPVTFSGKIKVTVLKNKKLALSGIYKSYSKKSRTFKLKITNHSDKTVEIRPDGAKAIHDRKRSYDRSMRLIGGKQKIKPGQTKTIKFQARGTMHYIHFQSYDIEFRCKLRKKTYRVRLVPEEYEDMMFLKKGKRWVRMS